MRPILITITLSLALTGCGRSHVGDVVFPDAVGVAQDVAVKYRGVEVGHVTSLMIEPKGVRITFRIDSEDVVLRQGDTARPDVPPLGRSSLEIVPGPSTSPVLESPIHLQATPPRLGRDDLAKELEQLPKRLEEVAKSRPSDGGR